MSTGTAVETTITLEIDLEISGTFHDGESDTVTGGPDNWKQGHPDTVEIENLTVLGTENVSFTLKELEVLIPGCTEKIASALVQHGIDDRDMARDEAAIEAYERHMCS